MKNTFTDKVVWITGASSGIGEALAIALTQAGARLILSSRKEGELEQVKERCKPTYKEQIQILPLDLSQPDTLSEKSQQALRLHGHIDMLINNAGIAQIGLVKDTDISVDRKIMEVDYFGTIALTKYLLPHFLERKEGHYVVTSSVMGYIGTPFRSAYAAAKHALHGYFDSLRAELWKESKNIHVTLICPGFVHTNVSRNALTGSGDKHEAMDKSISNGLPAGYVARRILKAIRRRSNEVVVSQPKEFSAYFIKRLWPWLFAKIVRNVAVR